MPWVKVADRLPEILSPEDAYLSEYFIVVRNKILKTCFVVKSFFNPAPPYWRDDLGAVPDPLVFEVMHWQPLVYPEPPGLEEGEKKP